MVRTHRSTDWMLIGGIALALLTVFSLPWTIEQAGFLLPMGILTAALLLVASGGLLLRRHALHFQRSDYTSRRLLELACDAVVVIGPDRRILDITPRSAALFGYPPETSLVGRPVAELLPNWSPSPDEWPTSIRGRPDQDATPEFRGLLQNGELLAMEVMVGHAVGAPLGSLVLLIRDVTRARRVREDLRAKEAHLRLIVEQMPAILWTTDTDLHITSTLGAGLAALNLNPAEVVGMSMLETLGRDDPECTPVCAHMRALQGESLTHEMEWLGRAFQVRVDPLRNHERRIAGTIGIVLDVTDRKQTMAELSARARQQAVIAALGQRALAGGGLDDLLAEATRVVCETLGIELCEVLELPPDGETLRARGVVSSLNVPILGRDCPFGVLCAHATRHRPFTDDDRNFLQAAAHVLATAMDRQAALGERLRLEEQLRQAQKMEAVGRLAGGIAHDFNNLLCIITGYTEMALMQTGPDSPLREFLSEINKAGNRAATLTGQLLAFSRKSLLAPKVLDLNALIDGAGAMLRRLIGEDIELVTVSDPWLPSVKADPNQLEQVLMNLAVNARDAMPEGGRLEVRTAHVSLDENAVRNQPEVPPGVYVMLAVEDNGCGMDETIRARIFEPFFTTKSVGKGTGLGLAMVYGIVKQSGGHINVESAPGQGTTIRVYLPAVKASRADAPPPPSLADAPVGTETVLLAEDEDGVRGLVLEVLRQSGYTVLEARDGEEALAVSERHRGPIHLLLTDVVMPRLGGGRLARRLIHQRPDTRVLFMSGFADSTLVRHEVVNGEIDCLLKPFTPETLTRKVRETLDLPACRLAATADSL